MENGTIMNFSYNDSKHFVQLDGAFLDTALHVIQSPPKNPELGKELNYDLH